MNVTSSRFTMHLRPGAARCSLLQLAFSSLTHGATRRPCRVHLSSVTVLVIVIFSIPSFSSVLGQCKCGARRLDPQQTRYISKYLNQQAVSRRSKGRKTKGDWIQVS